MKQPLRRTLVCLTLLALLAGIAPVPASAAGFRDVPAGHWAEDSIQRSVSLGFFQGESATRFGMGAEITRAAFAVVLSRFYGDPRPGAAPLPGRPHRRLLCRGRGRRLCPRGHHQAAANLPAR